MWHIDIGDLKTIFTKFDVLNVAYIQTGTDRDKFWGYYCYGVYITAVRDLNTKSGKTFIWDLYLYIWADFQQISLSNF